jgi:hypothetical protein
MSMQIYGAYHLDGKFTCGIACHELAHARFNLPDLYATNNTSFGGVGVWSVMAYGNWGNEIDGSPGTSPALFDPFSLELIDDDLVNDIDDDISEEGDRQLEDIVCDKILVTDSNEEYFLIQYRQLKPEDLTWYDNSLSSYRTNSFSSRDKGIIVYQVNLNATDNNDPSNMMVKILEAHGGIQNLRSNMSDPNANPIDFGDLYGYDKVGLSHHTDPNNRLYNGDLSEIVLTKLSSTGSYHLTRRRIGLINAMKAMILRNLNEASETTSGLVRFMTDAEIATNDPPNPDIKKVLNQYQITELIDSKITNSNSGSSGGISDLPSGSSGGTPGWILPAGVDGEYGLIPELGLFQFRTSAVGPADGESSIASDDDSGFWELVLPSVDHVLAWIQDEMSNVPTVLSKTVSVTSPYLDAYPYGGYLIDVPIPGVKIGDVVIATPDNNIIMDGVIWSTILGEDSITICLLNLFDTDITLASHHWTVKVLKN